MNKYSILFSLIILTINLSANPMNGVAYFNDADPGHESWVRLSLDEIEKFGVLNESNEDGRRIEILLLLKNGAKSNSHPLGVWIDGKFHSFEWETHTIGEITHTRYFYKTHDMELAINMLSKIGKK